MSTAEDRVVYLNPAEGAKLMEGGLLAAVQALPAKLQKQPAAQWSATIKALVSKGVKQAELDDCEILTWLQASGGSLTRAEVEDYVRRLETAEALVLSFPTWCFGLPAILKGWIDRVYAFGFAYGVGEHSDQRWGDRYGEGTLAGKRAMLIVTTGGWKEHYSARGINGPIDDLLFPINHGILHYPGYDVLPPFVTYRVDRLDAAGFGLAAERLRATSRGTGPRAKTATPGFQSQTSPQNGAQRRRKRLPLKGSSIAKLN